MIPPSKKKIPIKTSGDWSSWNGKDLFLETTHSFLKKTGYYSVPSGPGSGKTK